MVVSSLKQIPDVWIIEPTIFEDERGYFFEAYNSKVYYKIGLTNFFVQDNQSFSIKNTLRGLHYQMVFPQGKLIRVLQGEIYDVAVDLRLKNKTFGKWIGEYLSSSNRRSLWIPPGFAHGFLVLSDTAEVLYKTTDFYHPEYEKIILWNDKDLKIGWPLNNNQPIISDKDSQTGMGIKFSDAEYYDVASFEFL